MQAAARVRLRRQAKGGSTCRQVDLNCLQWTQGPQQASHWRQDGRLSEPPSLLEGSMTQGPPSDIFTRRVCLQLTGMDALTVRRNITYDPPDERLRMDIYYPRDQTDDGGWPAVIIVTGYPGTNEPSPTGVTNKESGWTISMCQLIGLSGMVAIAYTNRDP